ncbi:MAG: hypothetical protein HS099_00610 [Ardenticatenaceae bacterium]|nr:hypothetical protein [Ardenticatenaceae bacterium]
MGCGEGVTAVRPPHPTTKKHGRHCQRPCPHIHLLCLAQTGRRPYPHHKKARPSLLTAVPPHLLPTPGPNRPTAVPPTKSTAVIADGRAAKSTPSLPPSSVYPLPHPLPCLGWYARK